MPATTFLQIVNTLNPAPGAQVDITFPNAQQGGGPFRLLSFQATLLADADLGNREVYIRVEDPSTAPIYALLSSGVTQLAGESRIYSFVRGYPVRAAGVQSLIVNASLGDVIYPPGTRIRTVVINGRPADDWGAATMLVERLA